MKEASFVCLVNFGGGGATYVLGAEMFSSHFELTGNILGCKIRWLERLETWFVDVPEECLLIREEGGTKYCVLRSREDEYPINGKWHKITLSFSPLEKI